jgi:hypothetical protein
MLIFRLIMKQIPYRAGIVLPADIESVTEDGSLESVVNERSERRRI